MKTLRRVSLGLAVLAAMVMATPDLGSAYSYGAWVGMTGAKTVAVNPIYGIDLSTGVGAVDFKFDYGFSDTVDIFLDISSGYIMPRYDISGNNLLIAGLVLGSAPGLQIHGIWDELDMFALEYNVWYSASDWLFSGFDTGIIIAPTLKLGDFGVWVEGDIATGDFTAVGFDMNAGIYVNLGDNQISIGATGLLGNDGIGIGAWLWAPFGLN